MHRVLLVEDDADIREPLSRALEREGYEIVAAGTGAGALEAVVQGRFDLVILDLGLPDLDGLEVCRRIRRTHPLLAVLMLTARSDEIDLVVGLDSGADDYVAKPFRVAELLARIRALLRRVDHEHPSPPATDGLTIDVGARRCWLGDEELSLAPKEFELLAALARSAGLAVTREALIDEVWDEHWFGPTKTLDMHVSSLRRKLRDDPNQPRYITTVRGVGYRFEAGTATLR
ncbi:MAG: response regulator transcription factor [Ilumatobacteraceae bacterium]